MNIQTLPKSTQKDGNTTIATERLDLQNRLKQQLELNSIDTNTTQNEMKTSLK